MRSSTMGGQATAPQGVAGNGEANHTAGSGEGLSASVSGQTGLVESPTSVNPAGSSSHSADGMLLSGHEARAFPGIFTRSSQNYKM